VRDPALFLSTARRLTDLILQITPIDHFVRTSGLDQLVGHRWPVSSVGADTGRSDWIDRLPARARVRALAGVALLMLTPEAWPAGMLPHWFATRGYQSTDSIRPWDRVVRAWGPDELTHALVALRGWPMALRHEAGRGVANRRAVLQGRGYDLRTDA
jgi:hypothetical protein